MLTLVIVVALTSAFIINGAETSSAEKARNKKSISVSLGFFIHTVGKEETLAGIGHDYGVPWPEIAELNGLKRKDSYRIYPGKQLLIPKVVVQRVELGEASIYGNGDGFHGKKTANGEIFDRNKFTVAHRTLPFNTIVRITNLTNGKEVIVRVNDRGPFAKGRIADLAYAAALEIKMVKKGVQYVKIEIIKLGCKYCILAG